MVTGKGLTSVIILSIENPAQQLHWQNGEQLSGCEWSWWDPDAMWTFALLSWQLSRSAHGITLSIIAIKAIKKAKIFIGGKCNGTELLKTKETQYVEIIFRDSGSGAWMESSRIEF